jgi:hypothetical protein
MAQLRFVHYEPHTAVLMKGMTYVRCIIHLPLSASLQWALNLMIDDIPSDVCSTELVVVNVVSIMLPAAMMTYLEANITKTPHNMDMNCKYAQ